MRDDSRPGLFLSPATPCPAGAGIAMRAHAALRVFARRGPVVLLVADPFPPGPRLDPELPANVVCVPVEHSRALHTLRGVWRRWPWLHARLVRAPRNWRFANARYRRALAPLIPAGGFSRVHVFRLNMVDFAEPFLGRFRCELDLDDLESETRSRMAEIASDETSRSVLRAEARHYARAEETWLPRFDRVFVCSEKDRGWLAARYPDLRVETLPNTVAIPASTTEPRRARPFCFSFVGALGYAPNQDAVRFLLRDVLPRLAGETDGGVALRVAGACAPPRLARELERTAGVRFDGFAPDLAGLYAESDAVVVPLRAGGGTRIKLLEAMAYRRPVVSTRLGAEGIDVRDEEHVLFADDAAGFAKQCLRLMRDATLAHRLAERGAAFVGAHHQQVVLERILLRDS